MIFVLIPLASAAPILSTLTVHQPDAEQLRTLNLSVPYLDLRLGESLPGAKITVDYDTDRADTIFVEMRFETSLAVSLDGPHWQLDDFAHHVSPWLPAWTTDGLTLPPLTDDDHRRFPTITPDQLRDAIAAHLDSFPDDARAPTCDTPWSAPCFVGISTVWLRVSAYRDGELVETRMIEAAVPMGC
jgi:hypothetical protein